MEHGFTSGGQESGSVFSAVVCKIQARKHCGFLKVKGPLLQLPLDHVFCPLEVGCLNEIWKPSILSHGHHFEYMLLACISHLLFSD